MARSAQPKPRPSPQPKQIDVWLPFILAATALLIYAPSLQSGFVYDGRVEIMTEGFITSLSNLPTVLSLRVLSLPLMLSDRPGHLLYLMIIAAIWGKQPWAFHLASDVLHAANVALLFILLRRLTALEWPEAAANHPTRVRLALVAATMIFTVHPLSVETIAAVNYSSDLLVTLFTLIALLAATRFRPGDRRDAMIFAAVSAFCAFAAVSCKESGIAVALILAVFWFLHRRHERKAPWLGALGAAAAVTILFLIARFSMASAAWTSMPYLNGSPLAAALTQPRLWAFMFLKLVWPMELSADYTLRNVDGISLGGGLLIVFVVLALQGWMARKSRLGALGMALFWFGLATVSNLMPLHRVVADRFYYLPLAGVAMQLTALMMTLRTPAAFVTATTLLLAAIVPLAGLTLEREPVFATDYDLWSDTVAVSPQSDIGQNNLAENLVEMGRVDEAIPHARMAIELDPQFSSAHNNYGWALALKGRMDEAIGEFQRATELDPTMPEAHNNLGAALLHTARLDEAAAQELEAIKLRPDFSDAHFNLGTIYVMKGRIADAVPQFRATITLNPADPKARNGLGLALLRQGHLDEAIACFRASLVINPNNASVHNNLGVALMQKGLPAEAKAEFAAALQLDPNLPDARHNVARLEVLEHPAPKSPPK